MDATTRAGGCPSSVDRSRARGTDRSSPANLALGARYGLLDSRAATFALPQSRHRPSCARPDHLTYPRGSPRSGELPCTGEAPHVPARGEAPHVPARPPRTGEAPCAPIIGPRHTGWVLLAPQPRRVVVGATHEPIPFVLRLIPRSAILARAEALVLAVNRRRHVPGAGSFCHRLGVAGCAPQSKEKRHNSGYGRGRCLPQVDGGPPSNGCCCS